MDVWYVSPRFTNQKLAGGKLEDKVDVFEDQIEGWLLTHAQALCSAQYNLKKQAGFAVLTLVSTYFEAIESYYQGAESKDRSKEFFRKGFLRVFDDFSKTLRTKGYANPDKLADEVVNSIYEQLRCGLFHEGSTKSKLLIRDDTAPLGLMLEVTTGDVGSIIIDPCRFLTAVQAHFQKFIGVLRDSKETQLRTNFEKFFDIRLARPGAVPAPPVGTP